MRIVRATPELVEADEAAIDWGKIDAKTDAEIEAAVASDPDAAPILTEQAAAGGYARVVRKKLGLTQEAFAARYGLSLDTLRDWEQGAARPDGTALAYLRAIENQPDAVAAAYAAE